MKRLFICLFILFAFGCAAGGNYYAPRTVGSQFPLSQSLPINIKQGQTVEDKLTFGNRTITLYYDLTRTTDDNLKANFNLDADKFGGRGFVLEFIVTDNSGLVSQAIKKKLFREGGYKFSADASYFEGMRVGVWLTSMR